MASSQSCQENGPFEEFIRTLESNSNDWIKENGEKITKKGRGRKSARNRSTLKGASLLYEDMQKSHFDKKVIDLKCRESCILPCYGGTIAKSTFELFELPPDFYFSVVKTTNWVGKITECLFDIREGVIAKGSRGFLDVQLFNRKGLDLRLDQGCFLGQVVIKKFEY